MNTQQKVVFVKAPEGAQVCATEIWVKYDPEYSCWRRAQTIPYHISRTGLTEDLDLVEEGALPCYRVDTINWWDGSFKENGTRVAAPQGKGNFFLHKGKEDSVESIHFLHFPTYQHGASTEFPQICCDRFDDILYYLNTWEYFRCFGGNMPEGKESFPYIYDVARKATKSLIPGKFITLGEARGFATRGRLEITFQGGSMKEFRVLGENIKAVYTSNNCFKIVEIIEEN